MKLPVTIKDQTIEVDIPEEELIAAGWKKPVSKGRWKPAHGEDYYYVHGATTFTDTFDRGLFDRTIMEACLVYKTRQEAEKALARQMAIIRVNDRIDELNEGWEPEWGGTQVKTYVSQFRGGAERNFATNDCIGYASPLLLHYCKSEEVAEQIIRECEADLKVIFEV